MYEMLEKYGDKREKNGMIKGESKVRIEVTKRMISRGKLTLEDIAVFSNFSLSSVKELAECSRMIESLVHSRVEDTHYYVLKEATRHFKQDADNEGIALGEKVEKYGDEREQNGIEEGESKVRDETAKSMLASGKLSLNDISEYSGLPLSKLRELAGWNKLDDMFGV